jgi:hypothetical protein
MSMKSVSGRAYDSFLRYCRETPPSMMFPDDPHDFLADYIRSWVKSGHGVRACLGDFQTFLMAVTAIIHYWHKEPMTLVYAPEDVDGNVDETKVVERTIHNIFPAGASIVHEIFDPDFFTECAFNELHGNL